MACTTATNTQVWLAVSRGTKKAAEGPLGPKGSHFPSSNLLAPFILRPGGHFICSPDENGSGLTLTNWPAETLGTRDIIQHPDSWPVYHVASAFSISVGWWETWLRPHQQLRTQPVMLYTFSSRHSVVRIVPYIFYNLSIFFLPTDRHWKWKLRKDVIA